MAMVPMITGFIHRVILTKEVQAVAHLEPRAAVDALAASFFVPVFLVSFTGVAVFSWCAADAATPAIAAYAATAAAGVGFDALGIVFVCSLAISYKLNLQHKGGETSGLLSSVERGNTMTRSTSAPGKLFAPSTAVGNGGKAAKADAGVTKVDVGEQMLQSARTSMLAQRGSLQGFGKVPYVACTVFAISICIGSIAVGGSLFSDGWVSQVPTSGLVPKASYVTNSPHPLRVFFVVLLTQGP